MWVFELLLCVCVCVGGEALRIQEVWSCGYLNCFFSSPGVVLKFCPCLSQPAGESLFEDEPNWELPEVEGSITSDLVTKVILELESRQRKGGRGDESSLPLLGDDGGDILLEEKGNNAEIA